MVVLKNPRQAERTPFGGVRSPGKRILMRYELVIFSNQSRISFDPKAKLYSQWKQKLQAIAETVPAFMDESANCSWIFRSWYLLRPVKRTYFGNPESGCGTLTPRRLVLLRKMVKSRTDGVDVDLTMFFVGDAAGRMMGHATSRTKDFADTDR